MTIVKQIYKEGFVQAFERMGREDQFSAVALSALYEYYDNLDEDYMLDVIEICCTYREFETVEEAAEDYGWERDPSMTEEEQDVDARDHLEYRVQVIYLNDGADGCVVAQ